MNNKYKDEQEACQAEHGEALINSLAAVQVCDATKV